MIFQNNFLKIFKGGEGAKKSNVLLYTDTAKIISILQKFFF